MFLPQVFFLFVLLQVISFVQSQHVSVLSAHVRSRSKGFWFVDSVIKHYKKGINAVLEHDSDCEIRIFLVSLDKTRSKLSDDGSATIVATDNSSSPCFYVTDDNTFMRRQVSIFHVIILIFLKYLIEAEI